MINLQNVHYKMHADESISMQGHLSASWMFQKHHQPAAKLPINICFSFLSASFKSDLFYQNTNQKYHSS